MKDRHTRIIVIDSRPQRHHGYTHQQRQSRRDSGNAPEQSGHPTAQSITAVTPLRHTDQGLENVSPSPGETGFIRLGGTRAVGPWASALG